MPVLEHTYVRESVVRAVRDMEYCVSLDLGLRAPGEMPWTPIRFVEPTALCRRGRVYGTFNPATFEIELRRDACEATAAQTVAHELRHLWQRLTWTPEALRDKELKEADCRRYEREAMNRFWNAHRYWQRPERAIGVKEAA